MAVKRRDFIAMVVGAGVGVAATPIPWKGIDDTAIWTQNWSWIPSNPRGENTYAQTTSTLCPSACGLTVRLVAGNPVRALPAKNHPLGGGISALAAAEVQMLHSPARVRQPLKRGSNGSYAEISWEDAERELFLGLQNAGKDVAFISGDENSSSVDVLSALATARGSENIFLMPSEAQSASVAWKLLGGNGQIGYDLENSDFILAVGANLLESWGTFVRNRRLFAEKRPHGEKPDATLVYAGPVQNNTAAVADQWIPLKPGSETLFLRTLQLLISERSAQSPDLQALQELTGVAPDAMLALARQLRAASRPLVIGASEMNQGGGAALVLAATYANILLGRAGQSGNLTALPEFTQYGAKSRAEVFANDVNKFFAEGAQVKAAVFYEANPAYALPDANMAREKMQKIPFKAAFTAFMDETAALCDLVLPVPLGLERLDDIHTPYGCGKVFHALSRPIAKAPQGCRHGMDVLLQIAQKLGHKLPAKYEEVLRGKAQAVGADWSALLKGEVHEAPGGRLGVNWQALLGALTDGATPNLSPAKADTLMSAVQGGDAKGITLAPMLKNAMGTPQTGIPPFNVKTLRAYELTGHEMCVLLNASTAKKLGLADKDKVKIESGKASLEARVALFEGIINDAAGLYLGFGHTALDAFSRDKGLNVMQLFSPAQENGTGMMVWNQTGVTITKA